MNQQSATSPAMGLLRLHDIIGDRKKGLRGLIPVGRTTFLGKVKSGEYPQPVYLGPRTKCWTVEDILALIECLKERHGATGEKQ
jgi:predicted DNA-binding transcriptional regulator AlpA